MKTKRILYVVKSKRAELKQIQLLRVETASDYTKIDFAFSNPITYEGGSSVNINPMVFIRESGQTKTYPLLKADQLPLMANQLNFNTKQHWLFFSLYFDPIPKNANQIDVLEDEKNQLSLNFYKIPLEEGLEIL